MRLFLSKSEVKFSFFDKVLLVLVCLFIKLLEFEIELFTNEFFLK